MVDGFAHLDLSTQDPVVDILSRMNAAAVPRTLLVERWDGRDRADLDSLPNRQLCQFRLAFCFRRDSRAAQATIEAPHVIGLRVRGSDLEVLGEVSSRLADLGKYLVVHSDDGIGPLTDRLVRILESRADLKVYVPHLGWPTADGREDPSWRTSIRRLAELPTVVVGVSAIPHFSRLDYPHEDVRDYCEALLDAVGSQRAVPASGYPLPDPTRYGDYLVLASSWIHGRSRFQASPLEWAWMKD